MAHHSVESMRDRAFLKGRTAFRSDAEYNAALRGDIDDLDEAMQEQREDRAYELALEILGSANKGELEDIEWFVAASMSDTMTPDNPFFVEGDGGEETFQLSELPGGRVRLERFKDNKTVDIEAKALADAVEELSEKMDAKATEEEQEYDGMAGHYADPVEAAEAFRDVLNGTPDLEEDDLDCIARRLKGFRDGTTGEPLVFAGHFTLKPAVVSARKVVIVVDVRGEFAVEIDDALGVVSETAEAMECAEPSSVDDGIKDPVLAKLSEALVEDDLEEAFDFVKDDKFGDVELNCGKFLRWRDGIGTKKAVVVDDPDAQTWSAYYAPDIVKAVVAADRRIRCESLADALAELDSYGEEYSVKVLAVAKDVEKGMYADGKKFDFADEDGRWLADVNVRKDGCGVVVDVNLCEIVEVSKEDFVKVTKKFFEGFGK